MIGKENLMAKMKLGSRISKMMKTSATKADKRMNARAKKADKKLGL